VSGAFDRDRQVNEYVAFADRVAGLSEDQWRALSASCAKLSATRLWFSYEFAREFETGLEPTWTRTTSTGNARTDRFIEASNRIEREISPRIEREPGVAAALRAAGQAVLRHGLIDAETFESTYAFVEPVIPYASLSSSS
jgi:hypothetical protein